MDALIAHAARPAPCARATRWRRVTRDEAGATVRDRGRRPRAVRRRGHGDPRRRRAGDCSATPTPRSARALGGFEYNRNQVVLHTDERVDARAGATPGRRGTWTRRRATRPGAAVTMTYHMNRLQALPGPTQYFVSVNPGDLRPGRARHPGPRVQPPAVHVPLARGAGGDPRDLQGHRATYYAGAHLGLRLPRGRLPVRLRGGGAASAAADATGARGMRSHLLEGKVRHRRARPVVYALEHDVFYFALDLVELDQVDRSMRLVEPQPAQRPLVPRRRPLARRRRRTSGRPSSTTCAPQGEDPTGWRITLVTNLRVLGYVFNPASFYLCRDADGVLRVVVVEVHNTHLERHLYTLRPRRRGPAVRRLDGEGLLRVAVHRHGGPLHGARAGRPGQPAHRDQRAPGRRARARHEPRAGAAAPHEPLGAADAPPPSARRPSGRSA